MNDKYDVAIYGLWYGNNYGSIITYYALSKVIEKMGFSYAMIRNPLGREIDVDSLERSHPLRFAKNHYDITKLLPVSRLGELNPMFDSFLLGSDQMWNYHLSRPYRQSYFFDFVNDNKRKIAYATSFGQDRYLGPEEEQIVTNENLKRFNAISVRDDFSNRILSDTFNVNSEILLDPVFLCDKDIYEDLINNESELEINGEYIFAYILDPNTKIGHELDKIAEISGKQICVVFNQSGDKEAFEKRLDCSSELIKIVKNPTVSEWLGLFKSASFVLTDSFHGTCFSIIFEKEFIVLKNNGRGGNRFLFLLDQYNLSNRMITKPEDFSNEYVKKHSDKIGYEYVKNVINIQREKSLAWLKNALTMKIVSTDSSNGDKEEIKFENSVSDKIINSYQIGLSTITKGDVGGVLDNAPKQMQESIKLHPDIERCRMIASILKEYGIKNIVISSGTRNMSLARYFEANDCFTTYNVTDERSAAYFALGLSVKLNFEPVVITCTSGTAVTNYLPGLTEAFYQRVPIIAITGDRYPCYIGQMEAQMIKQQGVFKDVCKKIVQLPINWDSSGIWETRRMVCEAVLEATHMVKGPTHINFPINIIEHNPPEANALALIDVPIIHRVDYFSEEEIWLKYVDKLKKSKKIMVIYGQNNPLSENEKKDFDMFTEKYNCVVLTDHLSNVHNKRCINPYRLMKKITNDEFKQTLLPDLIIYVGGKRVLNCPLQGKIKSIVRKIPFWHIIEDGTVKDIYRKLTDVFGCSQNYFFKYFSEHAGNIQNDNAYYNEWEKMVGSIPDVNWNKVVWNDDKFTSYYTMGQLMQNLPKDSMLHLSVGNTFINCHNYKLDESITVYCNMGTNGIDGSCSAFMGQCAVGNKLSFLMIGDLSFFYDMNALWNKNPGSNVRIMLNNDHGAGLLRHYKSRSITHMHRAYAEGWIKSLGYFKYICAHDREEFDKLLPEFVNPSSDKAIFFEILF